MKNLAFVFIAIFVMGLFAGSANAEFVDPYGILPASTFEGNNPATGEPWKDGDQYRMVFITSTDGDGYPESSDIETYNDAVQALADASTAYDLSQASWSVIGSTADVDARDNTLTNWEEGYFGDGHPIYKLDGTLVASDFVDLWDGEINSIIDITEKGETRTSWPYGGTALDGTAAGQFGPFGSGGDVQQGNSSMTTQWIYRTWTGSQNPLPYYAMSDPFIPIPEPATLGLLLMGGAGVLFHRRRRN